MNKSSQLRMKHFSKPIDISCGKILEKLVSTKTGDLLINKHSITEYYKVFLYDLLDQIILPYSVFAFNEAQKKDTDLATFTGLIQNHPNWWKFWQMNRPLNAGLSASGEYKHDLLGIHSLNDGLSEVSVCYERHTPYTFTNKPGNTFDDAKKHLIQGFCFGLNRIKQTDWNDVQYAFENCFSLRFRQLIRHTAFYKWIMLQSLNPGILQDFRRDSALSFFKEKLKPVSRRTDFVNYEQDCLMRGDVPIFYQCPYHQCLYDGDGNVYNDFFERTAHEEFKEKWEFMKCHKFLQKNLRLLEKTIV